MSDAYAYDGEGGALLRQRIAYYHACHDSDNGSSRPSRTRKMPPVAPEILAALHPSSSSSTRNGHDHDEEEIIEYRDTNDTKRDEQPDNDNNGDDNDNDSKTHDDAPPGYGPLVPQSWLFSTHELIEEKRLPSTARRITVHVRNDRDMKRIVLRSDACDILIPSLRLDNASGTGRFTNIQGLLDEIKIGVERALSFAGQSNSSIGSHTLTQLDEYASCREPFDIILDDSVGVSQVESYGTADDGIDVQQYERTWPQREELGLCHMNVIDATIQAANSTVANLAAMVAKAKKICCFSGAGISVESKIPAFWVDADAMKGTWSQFSPEQFHINNIMSRDDVREGYWRMENGLWSTISAAIPNPAHLFFAQLYQHGTLRHVITQNIDRLHYRAGVPLSHITELHGNQWNVHCSNTECKKTYDMVTIQARIASRGEKVPLCDTCGHFLLPDTVQFGKPLDHDALVMAQTVAADCDLFICIGSSLLVQPANLIPAIAIQMNIPLVILNKTPCKYDQYATIRISEPCGEVLGEVSRILEASSALPKLVVPSSSSSTSSSLAKDDTKALLAARDEIAMLRARVAQLENRETQLLARVTTLERGIAAPTTSPTSSAVPATATTTTTTSVAAAGHGSRTSRKSKK